MTRASKEPPWAQKIAWAAQPGSQTMALACPIGEVLYEGTRGPGKTDWLCVDYAQHVNKGFGPEWRGILFRETFPQLADVVKKTKALFRQAFPEAVYNKSSYTWSWPDGEELLLRHMLNEDGYWDYHGHGYPFIAWEELTNWATLGAYDAMKACWRSTVPGIPKRYGSTANPFGIGHSAVKMRFVDPAPAGTVMYDELGNPRVRIHGHWSENKILLNADPDYPKRLAADRNKNRMKAWFLGSWDVVAGGFFDDVWDARYHEIEPFPIPPTWRVDRSFDWGSAKPFSVGWWAESDGTDVTLPNGKTKSYPRGSLFRIAEWYGWTGNPDEGVRMPAAMIARGIVEREQALGLIVEPGPADGAIYDTEPGEQSIADRMADEGIEWIKADKSPGSRKNGWDVLRQLFINSATESPEEAGIYVFNTCRDGFIRTVPLLPRDPMKPEDVNTKAEDHCGDESRYKALAIEAAGVGFSQLSL